jgi:thioredoxin-related protein
MRSKNRPAQKVLAVFFEEPNCTQCDFFHTQLMPLKQTQDYSFSVKSLPVQSLKVVSPHILISITSKSFCNLATNFLS